MVVLCAYLVVSYSLWPHGLQPTRILGPWGFSRQEYWSMLPCSPPGDLPDPGIEPRSSALQADSLLTVSPGKRREDCRQNLLQEIERIRSHPLCVCSVMSDFCDPLDAPQAPLSMGFSRQENWSGYLFFSPDLILQNIFSLLTFFFQFLVIKLF